jgi:hypothetical protein
VAIAGTPKPASTATPVKDVVGFVTGVAGAAKVTAAVPVAEASATEAAVTVTVPADVARAADVYVTAAPDALVVGEIDPHAAPVQFAPAIDHVTPRFCASFVTFAVNVCVIAPVARLAVPGVTDTLGGVDAVNVIAAPADFVPSATEVAVSVIVPAAIALGAVYVTAAPDALAAGETVPHALPVQLVPDRVQFTPLFAESFCSVAANDCVAPEATLAVDGATTTEISDPAVNVMVAIANFVASSTEVAVSVTVGGFGTAAGAVYITAAPGAVFAPDSEPQAAPVQPGPDRVHVVPSFFGSFKTVAVKLAPWLVCSVAVVGVSATDTLFTTGAGLVEEPPPHPENPAATIITHALIVATFVRSTPRRKSIYPPGSDRGRERHSSTRAFPDTRWNVRSRNNRRLRGQILQIGCTKSAGVGVGT